MALNMIGEALELGYWLQWQVYVCASIFIISLVMSVKITIKTSRKVIIQQLKSCDLCGKSSPQVANTIQSYRLIEFTYRLANTIQSYR